MMSVLFIDRVVCGTKFGEHEDVEVEEPISARSVVALVKLASPPIMGPVASHFRRPAPTPQPLRPHCWAKD
jgi:hypothetical protein